MQPPVSLTLVTALVGAVVALAAAIGLRTVRRFRSVAGLIVLGAGLLTGWLVLAVTGYALTLITIFLALPAALTLLGAATSRWRVPALVELVGVGVLAAALFVFEYQRGDLYALSSGLWWVACVVTVYVLTFFGRLRIAVPHACGLRDDTEPAAERTLSAVALLGFAWYAFVAWRLPNPGLLTLSMLAAAVLAVTLLFALPWSFRLGGAGVFGLAGLMFTLGLYAWLADASVPMAAAPVVLVAGDVAVTLLARLASGRALAGGQRTLAGRILGVLEPRDDTSWQGNVASVGVRVANRLLFGGTVLSCAIGAAEWYLLWASVPGVGPFLVLLALYLCVRPMLARRARRRHAAAPAQDRPRVAVRTP